MMKKPILAMAALAAIAAGSELELPAMPKPARKKRAHFTVTDLPPAPHAKTVRRMGLTGKQYRKVMKRARRAQRAIQSQ